jgi:hypothetical protein
MSGKMALTCAYYPTYATSMQVPEPKGVFLRHGIATGAASSRPSDQVAKLLYCWTPKMHQFEV